MFTTYQPFETASPALDAYRSAMVTHAPELSTPDREVAMLSYITADMFLRGLEAAGPCPTRENFMTALRGVSDYDGAGLIPGTVDLDASFGDFNLCWTFVRVNESGTAFEAALNGDGSSQWCG
nr:ABC transporter substrate-binding protein [Micromonospora sp. DSM 115978]